MATLPNVFTIIAESTQIANPQIKWRNGFDFHSATLPLVTDPIVVSVGAFVNAMIHSDAASTKLTCYHWARTRQPYPSGQPIFTFTSNVPGTADAHWVPPLVAPYVPVGGEVVARVDHEPSAGGKPGRSFFRGFFGEDDIAATSGGLWHTIASIGAYNVQLAVILSLTALDAALSGGAGTQKLVVVRYTRKTDTVHGFDYVSALNFNGVTVNKRTRKNKK